MKYFNHQWVRALAVILLVTFGTLFSIQLFARTSFTYDSLSFDLRTRVCQAGGTVIAVPPVGRLFLKSHRTPWQLIITLNEVDFGKLEKELNSLPSKQQWLQVFQKQILKAVGALFALVIFFGITGGALLMMAFHIYPPSRTFWYGMLGSFLLVILMIGTTVLTYNPRAIERPQYEGVLASAPWAMNLITMGLDNIEVIGDNLKKISEGLPMLYKQAGQIKNMGNLQSDLAVLHVSDIHNNQAAFDFIEQLVTNFKIRFIIDTGDLTDYGTPLEAEIIQRIARIKVKYIFVPGNHDSPLIIKRLKKLKSVKVITGGLLKIDQLEIEGQADSASQNYSSDLAPAEELSRSNRSLAERIETLDKMPDIVAVHNRLQGESLIGKVPLIIHGHDHRYGLTIEQNTVIDDAGTTGAAGIRGLDKKGVPYSATILYWKKDQHGKLRLHAADSIKINGLEGNLTIDRRTFPAKDR